MAKAGSWRTGLISAPFNGAIGNIISKGLEVKSRNNKKPTKINDITPTLLGFNTSSFFILMLKINPHNPINIIQRNIDPSCALQIEDIL